MIMRAKQDGSIIVFELEGHLDFETTLQFKEKCVDLIKKKNIQRVVFNMERLKFVGSTGINHFIKILKAFNGQKDRPKICNLSPEFVKIFKAYQTTRNPFQIYEDQVQAMKSFDLPPMKRSLRKKPLDN